MLLVNSEHK